MLAETSMLPIQSSYRIMEKEVHATILHECPLIVQFDQILTEEECGALIDLSTNRLQRSKLASKEISSIRTSSGMFFEIDEHPLVTQIEQKISSLIQVPIQFFEGLQILHYEPGQKFDSHLDYFSLQHPSSENNRISTIIMYLNDVEEGGTTTFPKLNLSVKPCKGSAVYFEYFYENDKYNEDTIHTGEPVIQGEKWIATQWVRRQIYR